MTTIRPKFIADQNVGKLTKHMRLLGFDTLFFTGETDTQMVDLALKENRVILTRDTHIPKRRLITSGKVKVVLIKSDNIDDQIQQVVNELDLAGVIKPFVLCLECNLPLSARTKPEITGKVPPYVFQTQQDFMECSQCRRIYWKGTHWQAMIKKMERINRGSEKSNP
jgi:uncharacterized protein with PIN domain